MLNDEEFEKYSANFKNLNLKQLLAMIDFLESKKADFEKKQAEMGLLVVQIGLFILKVKALLIDKANELEDGVLR